MKAERGKGTFRSRIVSSMQAPFIHLFIHFVVCYDRSIDRFKETSSQSAIQCFLYQFTVFSSCFKAIQQLFRYCFLPSHHFYPSFYLSFNIVFQKTVPKQDMTSPINLATLYRMKDVLFFFLAVCDTSSFVTRSVQLIFSILLQHHNSKHGHH